MLFDQFRLGEFMSLQKFIDNRRLTLKDTLCEIIDSGKHTHLSIATGYWDLPGMIDVIDRLASFESIRLLIGQEPIPHRLQQQFEFDPEDPENLFPDKNFAHDLEQLPTEQAKEIDALRDVAIKLAALMKDGILEVRVFRKPRLHAKAYIFGTFDSSEAVGIVGSSNFTKAGLTSNAELNYLEDDEHEVLYQPQTPEQCHGHLSWFNELWEDPEALPWTNEFTEIVEKSPVGDMTYGPYDVYIKTLMEVFPDELAPAPELNKDTSDVLYSFQNRNAGILLKKLQKMGVAMLADSVGLGKTITAGAVIKHYRDLDDRSRIVVIVPAALEQQWRDDLGKHFDLTSRDFEIMSMQNLSNLQKSIDDLQQHSWVRQVDLFVIDEAHNLRSPTSERYKKILEMLEASPKAPVLLMTATPVNNSLMDFANQIRLGLRGSLASISVQYTNSNKETETIDFFTALERIQKEEEKAEKAGKEFDWNPYTGTLKSGLRHYLVRSTRQGVEEEGSLVKGGVTQHFPKTRVEQLSYTYDKEITHSFQQICMDQVQTVFEGIDPLKLDLDVVSEITQQSSHPLDLYRPAYEGRESQYLTDEQQGHLFMSENSETLIPSIFQIVYFLGFVPYRPDMYRRKYYGKTREQIRNLGLSEDEQRAISAQRSIHNILHVTWLKRLESSTAALLKSVDYYSQRLEIFEKYLDQGFIVPFSDVEDLEAEYGEDIERAFSDYEETYSKIQKAIEEGKDVSRLEIKGVKRCEATPEDFELEHLKQDIQRDKRIIQFLRAQLAALEDPSSDTKLIAFTEAMQQLVADGTHGKKILIFSFFADTIEYLRESVPPLMQAVPNFSERSAFLSGSSGNDVEAIANRFAPQAKHYTLQEGETEIDFLFATDVLSEGQNLQDAGLLINYDLHWNPVRMIQRNGRINRLGSLYDEVLISNMKPHDDLELYLHLVRRLERKIDTIKHSIGTDQSVLGEKENPIEFADFYSDDSDKASKAAESISESSQALDVFDSTDEYIFELRRFLNDHPDLNDPDRQRVENMPCGKWNYLPTQRAELPKHIQQQVSLFDSYLVLESVAGKSTVSNEPFTTTMFVEVEGDENGRYRTDVWEEVTALSQIKTTPDDNAPAKDLIPETLNRARVASRANTTAKIKAEENTRRSLKPAEEDALKKIQPYCPASYNIQGIARNGIQTAQDEREFRTMVRLIRKEMKQQGGLGASTVSSFLELMKRLEQRAIEEQKAEQVESVLFYASRE